ncbi:hypothetical protein Cob_v001801 [Colletotrichum orbiculare MAFF 240422]|uniref:Uncharacterized protein n=1 Tax=Colletotrichum orbiculare (strain 104-T / ATCC 96160 / CBS 514.97 / LARS 414 / MAFF 240422) TaxID=1213857 RepID=A0A484G5X6_COLOR|nr:hypothetical protein Cob_v001801 [Colletotrichum orbiculare MAFF 240422]
MRGIHTGDRGIDLGDGLDFDINIRLNTDLDVYFCMECGNKLDEDYDNDENGSNHDLQGCHELIEVRRVEAGDKYLARDGDSVKWIAKDDWFTEAPSPQAINAPQRQGLKVSRERGQTHVAISKWLRDKLVTIARSVTKEVDCGSDKPRYRRQMVACRRSEAAWIAGQLAKDRDVIGQLRSGAPQLLQAEGLNGTELADSEQVASFGPAGSAKFILAALGLESEIRSVQEAAALGFLARVVIGAAWRGREQAGNVPYKFRVLEPQIISVNKYKLLTYGERRLSGLPRTTFAGDKSSMVVKFCKEVEKSKKDKYSWVVDSNGDRVAPKSRTRRAEAKEEYETHTAELSWTPLKDNKGDECTRSCVDAYKWMAAGTCGEHGRPTDEAAEKASWTDTCGTYSWSVKTSE